MFCTPYGMAFIRQSTLVVCKSAGNGVHRRALIAIAGHKGFGNGSSESLCRPECINTCRHR